MKIKGWFTQNENSVIIYSQNVQDKIYKARKALEKKNIFASKQLFQHKDL